MLDDTTLIGLMFIMQRNHDCNYIENCNMYGKDDKVNHIWAHYTSFRVREKKVKKAL